jgi:hypothetical protein
MFVSLLKPFISLVGIRVSESNHVVLEIQIFPLNGSDVSLLFIILVLAVNQLPSGE